jgi:hypothetical protein
MTVLARSRSGSSYLGDMVARTAPGERMLLLAQECGKGSVGIVPPVDDADALRGEDIRHVPGKT